MSHVSYLLHCMKGKFFVLDTKTTGPSGEVVQIAVVDQDGFTRMNKLVKPTEPGATRLHGITDDQVSMLPGWDAVSDELDDLICGTRLLIYNAQFDLSALLLSQIRAGVIQTQYRKCCRIACVMRAFGEHYGEWNHYYHNWSWKPLHMAAHEAGYTNPAPHTALGDALTTLAVARYLQRQYQERF